MSNNQQGNRGPAQRVGTEPNKVSEEYPKFMKRKRNSAVLSLEIGFEYWILDIGKMGMNAGLVVTPL